MRNEVILGGGLTVDLTWGLVLFSLRGPRCFGLVSLAVHFKGINKSLAVGGRAE